MIWLALLYKFKRLRKLPIALSLTCFLFFSLHIPSLSGEESLNLSNNPVPSDTLSGIITGKVLKKDKSIQFFLQTNNPSQKYLAIYFPTSEVEAFDPYFDMLSTGATCQLTGDVVLPEKSTNPGQFNYQHYLRTQGIYHQVIIDNKMDIKCEGISLLGKVYKTREDMQEYILNKYSEKTAAWMIALILGDDSFISVETIDLFRNWGMSHLLAISGLHVGLIVGLIYFIVIKMGMLTKEKAQWLMIIFLPVYALLAGGEPSVWRATIMVFLFIVFTKLKVNLSVLDVISIVFMLLILVDRFIVYHIGFQFSFIVTFGIILSREWLLQTTSPFYQLLKISFVSQLIILPFQFNYFFMVQPLSILLNVIVVPYFSLLIIPGMFLMGLFSPLPIIPSLLDTLFLILHSKFLLFVEWIDLNLSFPWINGSFPIVFSILYYVIFGLMMISMNREMLRSAFKYGISITVLVTIVLLRPYFSPYGTVTMLDIGQGDAFIIELPYRKGVIFMDAGATFSFAEMGFTDKVYKQVLKPHLHSKGIYTIDAIFISHEDMDHMGSVDFIAKDFNVKNIITSPFYVFSEESIDIWNDHKVNLHIAHISEQVLVDDVPFNVLSPVNETGSDNENSLVIQTELGGKTFLFTGDIGVDTERELMRNYPSLSVDVLKVGHHGSKTSTGESFINHINPLYALISVGENNTYGHPATDVIATLEEAGVVILRTDQHGAIIYRFKNDDGTFFQYSP